MRNRKERVPQLLQHSKIKLIKNNVIKSRSLSGNLTICPNECSSTNDSNQNQRLS